MEHLFKGGVPLAVALGPTWALDGSPGAAVFSVATSIIWVRTGVWHRLRQIQILHAHISECTFAALLDGFGKLAFTIFRRNDKGRVSLFELIVDFWVVWIAILIVIHVPCGN